MFNKLLQRGDMDSVYDRLFLCAGDYCDNTASAKEENQTPSERGL